MGWIRLRSIKPTAPMLRCVRRVFGTVIPFLVTEEELQTLWQCGRIFFGRAIPWFVFGLGLARPSPKAESAIGPVAAMLAFVLTEIVAMAGAVQKTGTEKPEYVWVYVLVSLFTLGPMTSILRSSDRRAWQTCIAVVRGQAQKMRHHYNWPTVYFTRWTLGTSAVLILLAATFGFMGAIPGQQVARKIMLPVDRVDPPDSQNQPPAYAGKPVLFAHVPINKDIFPNGIPQRLHLQVAIGPRVAEVWQLADAYPALLGLPVPPSQKPRGPFLEDNEPVGIEQGVIIAKLIHNGRYVLRVPLVGKSGSVRADDATTRLIKEGLTVTTDVPP